MSPRVLICMSDGGQDPTEVALPWKRFVAEGFTVEFATQDGAVASADQKLLEKSWFGRVLGAAEPAKQAYKEMTQCEAFQNPHAWRMDSFDMLAYDAVVLPGGHDKLIRKYLESPSLHDKLAKFWPYVSRDYSPTDQAQPGKKVLGSICHGALCLAFTTSPKTGQSLLKGVHCTTLPRHFERTAWYTSQLWGLGGYYRTYGPEGRWCADDVLSAGAKYVPGPTGPAAFACTDPDWRFVSARFPGDAEVFAEKLVEEIRTAVGER